MKSPVPSFEGRVANGVSRVGRVRQQTHGLFEKKPTTSPALDIFAFMQKSRFVIFTFLIILSKVMTFDFL